MMEDKLAIEGGEPVRRQPFPPRKPFGLEEAKEVLEALSSQNLFYPTGKKVYEFIHAFKQLFGVDYVVPATSGTSAIHIAVGAINPEPGDEIIVSPISDMGSVAPIVLCGAIPVFADVELQTFNLDPNDVADRITDRTRAIIAVHCWGRPMDLDPILEIARERGIYIIEDCAQSHLVRYKGKITGTIADFGAFSFQQSKHITCGDGGATIVKSTELASRAEIFADKGCDWTENRRYRRQYAFIAPCYRPSELLGAVLCAQIRKLPGVVARRQELGSRLSRMLEGIPGIIPPPPADENFGHGYWAFPILVVREELGASRDEFAEAMRAEGIPGGTWIGKPLYLFDSILKQITLGSSSWPFKGTGARVQEYGEGLCPRAERVMKELFSISLHEGWSDKEIEDVAKAVRKVATHFKGRK